MKLEQSFEVAAPVDRVWAALIDVERVAPCLPGAEITGRNEDGSYDGSFRVKIGPTAAAYSGKLELETIDEAAHTATMQAAGTDRRGQGAARAAIVSSVKEGGSGTTVVEVSTDYSITGRLARFERGGMIEEIGSRLLTEFGQSLQAMLAGPAEDETVAGTPAVPAADAAKDAEKAKRKPRKDLAAAADAVAAASAPGAEPEPVAAEPEPVAAEPEPVAAEPEPVAAEPEPVAAEPEPVAAEPEPDADAGGLPDLAVEAAAESELAAVVPEASGAEPAAEVPLPASVPEPPLPPPTEAEPLDGLALIRTVVIDRIKSNPAPLLAVVLGFLFLRRRRRRRRKKG